MLKTCLKYDFRATRKLIILMMCLSIGAGALAGGLIVLSEQLMGMEGLVPGIAGIFCMIAMAACTMVLFAAATVGYYYTFVEFYRNFFTDQGYLTFTLPVKRSTLYLSKLISGSLAQLGVVSAAVLGFAAMVLIPALCTEGFFVAFHELFAFFEEAGSWLLLWILPILALIAALILVSNGAAYLALVVAGTRVRKLKWLAALGIYAGISNGFGMVSMILGIPLSVAGVAIAEAAVEVGGGVMWSSIALIIMVAALIIGCIAAIFHYIAAAQLEKRINLA